MARCPVCAEALGAAVWRCEHCDTPAHPDCASYFGGCALFACRDARAPAPLEIESWPESVKLVRQLATVSRFKARAAVAYIGVGFVVGAAVLVPWWWTGLYPGMPVFRAIFIGQLLMLVMPAVFCIDAPIRDRLGRRAGGPDDAAAASIARVKASLPAQRVPALLDALTRPRVVIWLSVLLFALMIGLWKLHLWMAAHAVVFVALFVPIAMAGLSRALADIGDTEALLAALERDRVGALPAKTSADTR